MRTSLYISLFSFFVFLLAGCAKKIHPGLPDAAYVSEYFQHEASEINLPITISLDYLENRINKEMDSLIYSDNTMEVDTAEDKYKINVYKNGRVKLDARKNELLYTVPVFADLAFKKEILGFSLEKELQLELELDFSSALSLNDDWSYRTKTKSAGVRLKTDPVIEVGFISIPVSSVIEIILDYSMPDIATAMDDSFSESFDLSELMESIWDGMQEPINLSEEYSSWLLMTPKKVVVDKFEGDRKYLKFTVGVNTDLDVKVGKKPERAVKYEHPALVVQDSVSKNFFLSVPTEVSYKELSDLLNENLKGYKFEHGSKEITITDLKAFGNGGKIVIQVSFVGDAEGEIYLTGVPKFDNETQTIYIDNFDYDVKSKKALLKLASWIFKGSFKKHVEKELRYSFKENIVSLSQHITEGFNSYGKDQDLDFRFMIDRVEVNQIFVTEDGLKARTEMYGAARVHYGF